MLGTVRARAWSTLAGKTGGVLHVDVITEQALSQWGVGSSTPTGSPNGRDPGLSRFFDELSQLKRGTRDGNREYRLGFWMRGGSSMTYTI